MKYQVYFGIAIRIIILFGVGILWTFINPQLREFLGDIYCKDCGNSFFSDNDWIWGIRHYWYFWMMNFLFLLSVASVIVGVFNLVNKHYPNS